MAIGPCIHLLIEEFIINQHAARDNNTAARMASRLAYLARFIIAPQISVHLSTILACWLPGLVMLRPDVLEKNDVYASDYCNFTYANTFTSSFFQTLDVCSHILEELHIQS